MSRPVKYDNDYVVIKTHSFSNSFYKYLLNICKEQEIYPSDYIMTSVYMSDKEKVSDIIKDNYALKKRVKELESKVKDTNDAFGVQIIEVPYLDDFLEKFAKTRKTILAEGGVDFKVCYEIFISKLSLEDKMLSPQQAQMAKLKIREWIGKQIRG
jgi:predicted nuclease with TOPRIM domain